MSRSVIRFGLTMVRNRPIDFGDGDIEQWSRRDLWQLRPMSLRNWLTRAQPCGCSRRIITGHRTIYCWDHSGLGDSTDDCST